MNTHTIICGTGKLIDLDAYYILRHEKFWGIIAEVGLTARKLNPWEYRELFELGVFLTDIVATEETRGSNPPKDREKARQPLLRSVQRFEQLILEWQPKRILFHGKQVTGWVRTYKRRSERLSWTQITGDILYGKQSWLFKGAEVWTLPSTNSNARGH